MFVTSPLFSCTITTKATYRRRSVSRLMVLRDGVHNGRDSMAVRVRRSIRDGNQGAHNVNLKQEAERADWRFVRVLFSKLSPVTYLLQLGHATKTSPQQHS